MSVLRRFVAGAMLAALGAGHAWSAQATFSTSISVRQSTIKLGSPIRLTVTVQNTSAQRINISIVDPPELQFHVNVANAQGTPASLTEFGRAVRGESGGGIGFSGGAIRRGSGPCAGPTCLNPGESQKFEIVANKSYDFSQPGKYYIEVEPVGDPMAKSNSIMVTVATPSEWEQYLEGLQKPFALFISTPQQTIRAGSKPLVEIYLRNGMTHDIVVDQAIMKYDIQVRDSQGNEVPLTEYGRDLRKRRDQGGGRLDTIEPGSEVKSGIYIDNLRQPGEYTIQLARMDEDSKVVVKSNTISVIVTF
jgi:hypothetical protein